MTKNITSLTQEYKDRLASQEVGEIQEVPTVLIPRYIRTHFQHLTYTDKWLYVCLFELCPGFKSYPWTIRALERETSISKAAICRSIPRLQATGLIQAVKRANDLGYKHEMWHITLIKLTKDQIATLGTQYQDLPKRRNREKTIDVFDRETRLLFFQLERAQEAGLPATLTMQEWIGTLHHFGWKCAYCQGDYSLIEHFVPIALGGGTTRDNCVPACASCNNRKNSYHPLLMPASTGMHEAIEIVRHYLEIRRNEA